jgi:hypothetical protein
MSKINPLFFALGIPVVVIIILLAIVIPRGGKYADLSPFSVDAYRKDWAAMQGNAYRFDCQVDQQLSYVAGKGRVLAVKPTDGSRGSGRVPLFIPITAGDTFEVGQRFKCKIRVSRDLLVVEDLERF